MDITTAIFGSCRAGAALQSPHGPTYDLASINDPRYEEDIPTWQEHYDKLLFNNFGVVPPKPVMYKGKPYLIENSDGINCTIVSIFYVTGDWKNKGQYCIEIERHKKIGLKSKMVIKCANLKQPTQLEYDSYFSPHFSTNRIHTASNDMRNNIAYVAWDYEYCDFKGGWLSAPYSIYKSTKAFKAKVNFLISELPSLLPEQKHYIKKNKPLLRDKAKRILVDIHEQAPKKQILMFSHNYRDFVNLFGDNWHGFKVTNVGPKGGKSV